MTTQPIGRAGRYAVLVALWMWLPSAGFGFVVCGDGVCDGTATPAETPLTCPVDCGGGGSPTGCINDTCSNISCTRQASGLDYDYDGVPDQLEYDLAHKFFPTIWLQGEEDDRDQAYLYRAKAIPYTVEQLTRDSCDEAFECLEIRYGVLYFKDTGDTFLGLTGHQGDSEFYAVLVQRTTSWSAAKANASYWQIIRDFTAAHWMVTGDSSKVGAYGTCPPGCRSWDNNESACLDHSTQCSWFAGFCSGGLDGSYRPCSENFEYEMCASAGGSCRWLPPGCFPRADSGCYSASPVTTYRTLYAAEGKHGLYHSKSECDNGGFLDGDACPFNQYNMRAYKGERLQNVGNKDHNDSFDVTVQYPNNCDLYNVWSNLKFAGSSEIRKLLLETMTWLLPAASSAAGCTCGETSCTPVQAAYISHFTGLDCTGQEHYYTPYFGYDGVRRSWDGGGCTGTILRTVTNRSYKNSAGTCFNAWPNGNTLSDFVRVYR